MVINDDIAEIDTIHEYRVGREYVCDDDELDDQPEDEKHLFVMLIDEYDYIDIDDEALELIVVHLEHE